MENALYINPIIIIIIIIIKLVHKITTGCKSMGVSPT